MDSVLTDFFIAFQLVPHFFIYSATHLLCFGLPGFLFPQGFHFRACLLVVFSEDVSYPVEGVSYPVEGVSYPDSFPFFDLLSNVCPPHEFFVIDLVLPFYL